MRLLLLIFSIFLASCTVSKLSVEKGNFRAIKSPNIYGNNRYLPRDTNRIISYNVNFGKNRTINLNGVVNGKTEVDKVYNTSYVILESPANISYRLINNTLGLQYYKVTKEDNFYKGWGVGVQNFPYGFFLFGHNNKTFEVGASALLGLSVDKASYDGYWYLREPNFRAIFATSQKLNCENTESGMYLCCDDQENGICYDYTDKDEIVNVDNYIKLKDLFILHTNMSFNFYASYFWEKFSINYSASIYNPWLVDELPASSEHDADISFLFPFIIMQDIGVSYTPNNIKYRLGINRTGVLEIPETYGHSWGASLEMAYLW